MSPGEPTLSIDPGQPPSDLVRSVSRALRIVEVVGAHDGPVAPKVVARRCGLHLSTTYHLLRTLEFEGYLVRTADGDYALGLAIAARFRDLTRRLTHRPAANILRSVAAATGHSAYLSRFVDGRVAVVAVAEGPKSPHIEDLVVGFDEGAHATALGKALLSTVDAPARRAYLDRQGLRRFTRATIRDPEVLQAEVEAAAALGSPFVEEEQYRDGVGCGAIVGHADGAFAIAVSAPVHALRARLPGLLPHLRSARTELEDLTLAGLDPLG